MIDKKNLIKMAEHVFRKSEGYPDRRLMHPRRDWGIGILFFTVLVFSGSLFAGKIFVQYATFSDVQGVTEKSVPEYREVIAQDALELYRQKQETFNLLKQKDSPRIKDKESIDTKAQQTQTKTAPTTSTDVKSLIFQ